MKVGIVGSMQNTEKMMAVCESLRRLGHEAYMSKFAGSFIGKNYAEKERIKLAQKYQQNAIREGCKWVKDMDAIVVANYDKHDIPNYIGGNAFIEMAYAYMLEIPIFLLNPIPDMPYYGTEILAMKPTVLHGNLRLLAGS